MEERNTEELRKNLRLYRLYMLFCHTPFMLPVIVLFWQDNGLDLFDIYVLQSAFAVAVALFEIPTGMVADLLGRKRSLQTGMILYCVGFSAYALGGNFWWFLCIEILLAAAWTMISGADGAWLYDTLRSHGREYEYQFIEGRARSRQMVSFAFCCLVGGLIGEFLGFAQAMAATAIGPFLAFFCVCGFTENRFSPKETQSFTARYKNLIYNAGKFVIKHRFIRWLMFFSAICSAGGTWLLWVSQPYFQFCDLPVWSFGIIFASYNLFAAFASGNAAKVADKVGRNRFLVLLAFLSVSSPLLMGFFPMSFAFLFTFGQQAVRGSIGPVINAWIMSYTFSDKRATVLSLSSLLSRLFFALSSPLIGYVAARNTPPALLLFQAAVLLVLFVFMWWAFRRIDQKYFRIKTYPIN